MLLRIKFIELKTVHKIAKLPVAENCIKKQDAVYQMHLGAVKLRLPAGRFQRKIHLIWAC
jgi:hypothetical protein